MGRDVRSGYGVALRDRSDVAQRCARHPDLRSDRIARSLLGEVRALYGAGDE
ncbi:MAG: hypothetical protein JO287_15160 [Pseudonocardiales bacterium]|nr:hypothetical protein [Pseudonocardiales bacterium]